MLIKKNQNILFLLAMTVVLGFSQVVTNLAQPPQEQTKSIQSDEFTKSRPAPVKREGSFRPARYIEKKRTYAPAKKTYSPSRKTKGRINVPEDAALGLTIWKKGSTTTDEAAKGLFEQTRIESETALAETDSIRLSIESLSRKGYLYIVDREYYSDGTYGKPYLLFPSLNYRNGNNYITPGSPIFIPQTTDYFEVKQRDSTKKQVAEVLTIIVHPKKLIDMSTLTNNVLSDATFASWLKWEVETNLLEQENGAGAKITPVEQAAYEAAKGLSEKSSPLTQGDAPPQSVYVAKIKRTDPLLVNVFLKMRSN
jgi:hypothetical protein